MPSIWAATTLAGRAYDGTAMPGSTSGPLFNIGASAAYSSTSRVLELAIPVTAIDQPDSLVLMLFTMDDSGVIQDACQPARSAHAGGLSHREHRAHAALPGQRSQQPRAGQIEHNTPVLTCATMKLECLAPFSIRPFKMTH